MKSYGLRSAWVNWSSKSGDFAQLGEPTFSDNCYEGVRSHETSRSLGTSWAFITSMLKTIRII